MDTISNSGVLEVLVNITSELKVIWPVIMKLSAFVGFLFVGIAVLTAINPQYTMMMRSGTAGLPNKKSMIFFFCGIVLFQIPGFVFHVSDTLFNNSSLSVNSYTALTTGVSATGTIGVYLNFFVAVVMFLGLLSMIKGVIVYAVQDGNIQAFGATLMHIGVGSILMNFTVFLHEIGLSLGGVYQSNIEKFF